MNIGEKIRKSRKGRGLSQEKLAEELMVSRAAVAKWEGGYGMPDIENLKKLSSVLETSIDELLDGFVESGEGTSDNVAERNGEAFDNVMERSDEDLNNAVERTGECLDRRAEEFYRQFIGQKCNVEMIDWNDGIWDSYLINEDRNFFYYVTVEKKCKKVGALAKKYIEKIALSSGKDKGSVELSDFCDVQIGYFVNKAVDIYLQEKHFLDGLLGGDTELQDVTVLDVDDQYIRLAFGKDIECDRVTKIECCIE